MFNLEDAIKLQKMKSQYYLISLLVLCDIVGRKIDCYTLSKGNVSEKQKSSTLLDFLSVAEGVLHSAKQYVKITSSQHTENPSLNPMDCAEILERNSSASSGVYEIWPRSRIIKCPITVYCDMEDDGGAWTIIQRRGDFDSPKDYFYRDWQSYKTGFGDPLKDFWLGNDNIFALTNERACSLKFTLSDWEGNTTYATYDAFWIDDEAHKYVAHVTGYRGTAGDGFGFVNGNSFTTKDNDNDKHDSNCAVKYKGAWWYRQCLASNLNGLYLKGPHESYADGVEWLAFRGANYSLKDTFMKIRPNDLKKNKLVQYMTPR